MPLPALFRWAVNLGSPTRRRQLAKRTWWAIYLFFCGYVIVAGTAVVAALTCLVFVGLKLRLLLFFVCFMCCMYPVRLRHF